MVTKNDNEFEIAVKARNGFSFVLRPGLGKLDEQISRLLDFLKYEGVKNIESVSYAEKEDDTWTVKNTIRVEAEA